MFLASDLIRARCNDAGDSLIKWSTYEPGNVRQASYDLRLGPDSYVVGDGATIRGTLPSLQDSLPC